ncbi:hypothetical protein Tco_0156530 [Tanacetum coccineum]
MSYPAEEISHSSDYPADRGDDRDVEEPSDDDDDDAEPVRTTPGPGYEVGESSAAGAARQVGPTIAGADLYRFSDMLDVAPGCQASRELGYGD